MNIDTLLAAGGHFFDPETGAVVPPIHTSTTFARDGDYDLVGDHVYGRYSSPTATVLERLLARLDDGAEAMCFGSGLGAAACLLETLPSGARLVAPSVMYHGAQDWFRRAAERHRIELALFDAADPDGLAAVLAEADTALVWVESPVNPTWDVVDIERAAELAHAAGAALVVDSTVAPPVTTRPLTLGADLVLHSTTKYLNGHSDVLGGALVTRTVDARWEELARVRKLTGGIMPPFDAWLLMRGLRTLGVRYERASRSALTIAQHLEDHPRVERCLYPGLPSHPGHTVAARQMTGGFGGMLSFLLDGDAEAARGVATRVRVFRAATSLGGVESHVEHRASVEGPHSLVPKNLLRLSIGLEAVADLIDDLDHALTAT